jgi:putative ABC transport system permease protein
MSISAMGMLNTLSISLLQRTKEVGILKALGTKRADIFKMFIFEAFLISFFGGAIGLLFGYGAARGINYGVNILAGKHGVAPSLFVEVPSIFVTSVVAFIFFLGLITGLFPAMRASKIHALEALRYE